MYHMKSANFGQCSCGINNDKSNYPEETELDTNPCLTLARTLTLSTGERISGHFTFSRCYDTMIFNVAYMNSPKNLGRDPESRSEIDLKRKITIAWNWRLRNKYARNRSWRKSVSDHVAHIGRGPEGSTMHPPTSLQNYVFLNPQSVHNEK